MYSNVRKPSEIIALQKKLIEEQEGIIAILKGALAAACGEAVPVYRPWMGGLTPQEQALLGALYSHYPNPVGKYELLELIPGYDHVVERQAQLVSVKVHHLRKKLGADVIENVRGLGYRMGQRQYLAMRDGEATDAAARRAPLRLVEERRAA
ncbi:winged helix-turn-helix domain-containing protein [Phenylobacterium sp.]|uniref:winged helix-turn-helix domain-containing protein n=1 Tax=Phenylobacterium sp. TaxID=1871053 RepID=UPI002EDB4E6D